MIRASGRLTDSRAQLSFTGWPSLAYLLVVASFMAITVAVCWPEPELGFQSDKSPVSWLSSAQLWTASVLSLRLISERVLSRSLGAWLFIALAGLAFDEQFMFREQWKYGCADWFAACQHAWVTELPMALVGVLGFATLVVIHLSLPGWPARLCLWSAYLVGAFVLFVDLFNLQSAMMLYEEAFEVVSEALFLGLLLGLRRSTDWRKWRNEGDDLDND